MIEKSTKNAAQSRIPTATKIKQNYNSMIYNMAHLKTNK